MEIAFIFHLSWLIRTVLKFYWIDINEIYFDNYKVRFRHCGISVFRNIIPESLII